jgi:hypothetical protein
MTPRNPRYSARHDTERRRLAPLVAAGGQICPRCGLPIRPDQEWDLDHDDLDPSRYLGASHRRCNRATSGRRKGSPIVRPNGRSSNGNGSRLLQESPPKNPAHAELEEAEWAEEARANGAVVWSQRW